MSTTELAATQMLNLLTPAKLTLKLVAAVLAAVSATTAFPLAVTARAPPLLPRKRTEAVGAWFAGSA